MKELSKVEVEAVLSGKALPGELLTGESLSKYFARLYLHAKEYRDAQIAALEADLNERRKITSLSMGVGDGTGQLFVHGDYDSIKAAQSIVFRAEDLSRQLAQRDAQIEALTAENVALKDDLSGCNIARHRLTETLDEVKLYRPAPPAPVKLPRGHILDCFGRLETDDDGVWLHKDAVIEAIEEAGGSVADE